MRSSALLPVALGLAVAAHAPAWAAVGDPQARTDHPWYPGELACSTFARLQSTQAELYRRVTGLSADAPLSDEQRALASWLWRNTHYWHGEEGAEDLWGQGWGKGPDTRTREYWTGLFAHGFGLCGTTHSQWTAEFNALLGHGRGRGVGVAGHNSFEAFLTGGPYGAGRWVLLDHDLSTVIFNEEGTALLSIPEVVKDWKRLTTREYRPDRQRGWLVCGLDPRDGGVYADYNTAEYLAGYAGPPPVVRLRRGESLRRYLRPGLEDGKTFVFWGRNYRTEGIPGPERSQTWVNQPERMWRSREGAGYRPGQARYANAVYTYRPDFGTSDYREGVTDESDRHVTLEFVSPYIIGATPADGGDWGIYQPGGRNGLVVRGRGSWPVHLSVDGGRTWKECGPLRDGLDLTDHVKGYRQYRLRLGAGAPALRASGLTLTTVCQANSSVIPRLKDGGTVVEFEGGGRGVVSAGPNLPQAEARRIEGAFGSPRVSLELAAPRGEAAVALHAAAHLASGNPPDPAVRYQVEYSVDGGRSWVPLARDWSYPRRGEEPKDFWSQSMCWGAAALPEGTTGPVRVRFHNNGGRAVLRAEAHLLYREPKQDGTRVTFAWTEGGTARRAERVFTPAAGRQSWSIPTGKQVETRWVEYAVEPGP